MKLFPKTLTINISEVQHETLQKLRKKNIKIGTFVRNAIKEKLIRDADELIDKSKYEYCPFSNGTIILKK